MINRISPNLDELIIFFLILLLVVSIVIPHFTSFNLFSVYTLLTVSFLSIFIFCDLSIGRGSKYIFSKLSLYLVLLLIPSVFVANLINLSFFLVYGFFVFIFFIVLIYLMKKGKIEIK